MKLTNFGLGRFEFSNLKLFSWFKDSNVLFFILIKYPTLHWKIQKNKVQYATNQSPRSIRYIKKTADNTCKINLRTTKPKLQKLRITNRSIFTLRFILRIEISKFLKALNRPAAPRLIFDKDKSDNNHRPLQNDGSRDRYTNSTEMSPCLKTHRSSMLIFLQFPVSSSLLVSTSPPLPAHPSHSTLSISR